MRTPTPCAHPMHQADMLALALATSADGTPIPIVAYRNGGDGNRLYVKVSKGGWARMGAAHRVLHAGCLGCERQSGWVSG